MHARNADALLTFLHERVSRVSYPASGASMLRAQVCALERLHTLTLVARPKTAPRRQGLPLRAYVPCSCVCTSVPTHLESRSISEDSATTAGFGPAQMPGAGARSK